MAAITRRPRLAPYALVMLSLIAASCSLLKPAETVSDKQEHAARLAKDGKHADAAKAYADLAVQLPADSDNYELLSAEQWVAAGNVAAAKQALAQVSPEARTKLGTARALVSAEIAYTENDPTRAIRELDQIPVPTAPEQAQNYYWLRGRSAFLTNHPVEGTRALVEREHFLTDPAALKANREELLNRVRTAAERGAPMKAPPKSDPVVVGWLDLGPVAVELERNPARAAAALDAWKRQFPTHPANTAVLATAQTQIAVATEYPNQIALLLPLSGRSETYGAAVRDGFIAAYMQQSASGRPRIAPGTSPSSFRCSCGRMSTSTAPSVMAANAASGRSRVSPLRASASNSSMPGALPGRASKVNRAAEAVAWARAVSAPPRPRAPSGPSMATVSRAIRP